MSKIKHTPEPWRVYGSYDVADPNGTPLVYANADAGEEMAMRNAARIVACVNACAGLDDPINDVAAMRLIDTEGSKMIVERDAEKTKLSETLASIDALNNLLRNMGLGQGEIDYMGAQEEEIDALRERARELEALLKDVLIVFKETLGRAGPHDASGQWYESVCRRVDETLKNHRALNAK